MKLRDCAFVALVSVVFMGCAARKSYSAGQHIKMSIPTRCITYFQYPSTSCHSVANKADVYLCKDVLVKSSCIRVTQ